MDNLGWGRVELLTLDISITASFTPTQSGNLSTLFDVGGIIGGIVAGVISDYSGMSATTCAGMLTVAIPMVSLVDLGLQ